MHVLLSLTPQEPELSSATLPTRFTLRCCLPGVAAFGISAYILLPPKLTTAFRLTLTQSLGCKKWSGVYIKHPQKRPLLQEVMRSGGTSESPNRVFRAFGPKKENFKSFHIAAVPRKPQLLSRIELQHKTPSVFEKLCG